MQSRYICRSLYPCRPCFIFMLKLYYINRESAVSRHFFQQRTCFGHAHLREFHWTNTRLSACNLTKRNKARAIARAGDPRWSKFHTFDNTMGQKSARNIRAEYIRAKNITLGQNKLLSPILFDHHIAHLDKKTCDIKI